MKTVMSYATFSKGKLGSVTLLASDARGVLQMARYYLGLPYTILARRQPIHPNFRTKYNPSSGSPILPLQLPDSSLSPLDGQFTNRHNSPGSPRSSADLTMPGCGTFG